jgi:hypothetical protein
VIDYGALALRCRQWTRIGIRWMSSGGPEAT